MQTICLGAAAGSHVQPLVCLHAADSVAEVPRCRESRHVPQVLRSVSGLEHIIGGFNRLNSVTKADLNINTKHWF